MSHKLMIYIHIKDHSRSSLFFFIPLHEAYSQDSLIQDEGASGKLQYYIYVTLPLIYAGG